MKRFRDIKEFTSVFAKTSGLLHHLYENRDGEGTEYDRAVETLSGHEELLLRLIDFGVIEKNGHVVEMNETYIRFFEEILNTTQTVNSAVLQNYLDEIRLNIKIYLETTGARRSDCITKLVRLFRRISVATLQNVSALKHNVDDTYKQEPDFTIKKVKLQDFDQKREQILSLIDETHRLLQNQDVFLSVANESDMALAIKMLRSAFTRSIHSLLSIQEDIIKYINRIDYQSNFVKNVRKLKYLKDRHLLRESTNVMTEIVEDEALWLQKRPQFITNVSIPYLTEDSESIPVIDAVQRKLRRELIEIEKADYYIDPEYLDTQTEVLTEIDRDELFYDFSLQECDLFSYLMGLDLPDLSEEDRLVLFVQMLGQYTDGLNITDRYAMSGTLEYVIVEPK